MSLDHDSPGKPANGRRVVWIIVAVAFIASATTAMLAFTASHRARERDAKALAADTADLRAELDLWRTQLADAEKQPSQDQGPYIDRLVLHTRELSLWKPRTPCGQDARGQLVHAMEARLSLMLHESAPPEGALDEAAVLDGALRQCEAMRGRDVNI